MAEQHNDITKTAFTLKEAEMMILFGFTLYGKVWSNSPDSNGIVYQHQDYTLRESDILEINTIEQLDWIVSLWDNKKLIFYPLFFNIRLNKNKELNIHIETFYRDIDFVRGYDLTVDKVPYMLRDKLKISKYSYDVLTSRLGVL